MKNFILQNFGYFRQAFIYWRQHNNLRLSAAMAFYSIFALVPIIVLGILIANIFINESTIQAIIHQTSELSGIKTQVILDYINIFRQYIFDHTGIISVSITIVGFYGSICIFSTLKESINLIMGVKSKKEKFLLKLAKQLLFALITFFFVLLIIIFSVLINVFLNFILKYANQAIGIHGFWFVLSNYLSAFIFFLALLFFIFKFLPNIFVKTKSALYGAFITSIFFLILKSILYFYFSLSGLTSIYGATATIFILLLWIYYSSQILFFGMELTKVISDEIK